MIPFLAALSIALYALLRAVLASLIFFWPTNFLISFIELSIFDFRRKLKTRFRIETRRAFFADLVIGIFVRGKVLGLSIKGLNRLTEEA